MVAIFRLWVVDNADQRAKTSTPERIVSRKSEMCLSLCVLERKNLFVSEQIFHYMEDRLVDVLTKIKCDAHIYLFMPDHCHMLIEGQSETSDVWKCVVEFKRESGYWLARNHKLVKWQKDFYDHILRNEDDLEKQVRYILGNPLRKGLVEDWNAYPYKGSTLYDFCKW